MWVYQEPEIQPIEKGPITPPPSLPPVPEQEPLPAIVQSTPGTTVPHIPETEVLSRTAPASHRERSAPHQGCVLLAGSYLSGAFTAGILQALLDTAENGHAFLLPALLARPVCCPERFTDCTAVRHRTAYDFGSPLRSVAVGVIRHRACAHLSFYHAVWRWSRAIDIPAVFRHTTSAGVVLSFYFLASRRHWLRVHFAGLAPVRWKSAEDSMLFLLGGGGALLPMPSCYWDNLH